MSKHASSVIKASGFLATFNHKLFSALEKIGIPEEKLYELLKGEDSDFMAKIVEVFAESVGTLAGMIAACKFRYANPDINERNFPLAGPVADVADMLAVSQKDLGGKDMTTAQIETAIDRKGYRSATLAEQLVYAKAKWNGRDWVVALGSSWVLPDGDRAVPSLCGAGRLLDLYWAYPVHRWYGVDLFLVVRK